MKDQQFDFNDAVQGLLAGKNINGKDGVLAPLVKQLVEAALEAELDTHIAQDVFLGNKNRKNGKTSKTIKSTSGKFELETPRDRAGTFEPQLVKKNQSTISNEIEERILSMYGLGLSYRDIIKHVQEIYQIELSTATISAITDKIIDKVKAWQSRPLEAIYPFVWLDAIHYKSSIYSFGYGDRW
jgi:putative transposase